MNANAAPARLYYLDRLRVFLTALVIVHHAAITYGAGGSWYFIDVDTTEMTVSSILLTLFTAINQSFFMGLFFFLSGYFTPSSYDRKGPSKFLADRFVRLGVPLAAFHFALGPIVGYMGNSAGYASFAAYYRAEVLSFRTTHFGPLWFVEALLYFALAYALWRRFRPILGEAGRSRLASSAQREATAAIQQAAPGDRALLLAALAFGAAAFLVRLVFPTGATVLGLQLGYFPAYIALYIAGIAAHRGRWLDAIPQAQTKRWTLVSLAAIPVLPIALIATGALDGHMTFAGGINLQAIVYAFWEPFVGFGIMLWLLQRFARRNAKPSQLQQAQNDAAYGAYIVHPLVVVAFSLPFAGQPLHPNLKFVVVSVAGVAFSFALAWLLRRLPYMNRIL
ncbi:acyltransferase family protein [Paenibacillus sp. TRM 82003]|nr:acyltransferase family protein [Paenibacillus sp. TRM 82003]